MIFSLNCKQTAQLDLEKTCGCDHRQTCTEIFSSRLLSVTHFQLIFLKQQAFLLEDQSEKMASWSRGQILYFDPAFLLHLEFG